MIKNLQEISYEDFAKVYANNSHMQQMAYDKFQDNSRFWLDEYLYGIHGADYSIGWQGEHFTIENVHEVAKWARNAESTFELFYESTIIDDLEKACSLYDEIEYGDEIITDEKIEEYSNLISSIEDGIFSILKAETECSDDDMCYMLYEEYKNDCDYDGNINVSFDLDDCKMMVSHPEHVVEEYTEVYA